MSLDDDTPPIAATPAPTPAHVLLAQVDDATRKVHARGRRESARKSYAQGSAFRLAANEIRYDVGLPMLDYDGTEWTP